MSLSVQSRRLGLDYRVKQSKFAGVQLSDLIPPITQTGDDDQSQDQSKRQPTSAELALDELEEKYQELIDAVNVDKFKPELINRYISYAENRRGAAFTEAERKRFREMSQSKDKEVIRLLALELRIGVPKRVEREALAAMGNVMLNRDQDDALRSFLDKPGKDPNLTAYVRTILMTNKVERVMGQYEVWKEKLSRLVRFPSAN